MTGHEAAMILAIYLIGMAIGFAVIVLLIKKFDVEKGLLIGTVLFGTLFVVLTVVRVICL